VATTLTEGAFLPFLVVVRVEVKNEHVDLGLHFGNVIQKSLVHNERFFNLKGT